MTRTCERCGKPFEAKTAKGRFCGGPCRSAAGKARARGEVVRFEPPAPDVSTPTVGAVRAQLEALGKVDDPLGAAALILAAQLDARSDSGSSLAALARELRATLTEVGRGAKVADDPMDELKARREQRQRGA